MLNQIKSAVYGFSLFPWLIGFVLVGKLASVVAVFWTPIRVFASAKNSESYLNQFSGKREVRVAGSISNLILGF
ncbi:hypothetical protein [Vibrio mimicus]|uniref:hypothetical protein n=1 Tax=Vibrio mimicus TaxID=674 RepID=UPI00030A4597|nr:hypothetical protein [Vibrio mimicus]KFE29485.1 hypothetical protein DN31_3821 [Vibrio mimicus]